MRDTHQLKEKFELSLDSRQVVTLTVAALAVIGGVFVLGVVVGKRMAGEALPKEKGDLLSTLDQKTQALESVQHDASLTFQEELTKKPPPAEPAPKVPEPKRVDEKKVEAPKLEDKKPEEKKVVEAKVDEPKPAEAKVDAPEAKAAPVVVARAPEPHVQETVKEEPVATRTRDGGALKEAFGKLQKSEPLADSPWSLQMASYQDRAEAERFAAGLRDKGYAPYVVSADVTGKGTWYRVKVGRFSTKEAASRYLTDFKRETQMNAIVTGK